MLSCIRSQILTQHLHSSTCYEYIYVHRKINRQIGQNGAPHDAKSLFIPAIFLSLELYVAAAVVVVVVWGCIFVCMM